MIPINKVRDLISKHKLLEEDLSTGAVDKKKFAEKSKEYAELNEIIKEANRYISFDTDKQELEKIINDDSSDKEMIELAINNFGSVDQVVANAGITLFGSFLDYSSKDFMEVMRVNLLGSFLLTQASAQVMKEQEEGGAILLTSSVTAHQSHENLSAYAMSKAALEMLAKNLVLELAPLGIRINAIAPGATLTERTTSDPDYAKTWSKLTPLGRPASVEDIANSAVFLLSDAARHITGQTLIIDGGWTSISPSPYA